MRDVERRGDNMKKLITMLLAMGLLTLLSLSTVAYADEGGKGNGKNGNGDNGEKDHKQVVICFEKDDELKLIEVKKDDLEKYLEDGAFFPKAKVLEEDKDKATVKFLCDNGDGKDDKKTIYPYQADNDENGHKAAAIGIRQTALVL
jgi:hypothetical protein